MTRLLKTKKQKQIAQIQNLPEHLTTLMIDSMSNQQKLDRFNELKQKLNLTDEDLAKLKGKSFDEFQKYLKKDN